MGGNLPPRVMGTSEPRVDGRAKVTGTATYAYEQPVERPTFAHLVQATIARGRVRAMDTAAAEALDGVLAVLTPFDAPRLEDTGDAELAVLQSDAVAFRGQIIGVVVAETPEGARHAASLVRADYDVERHDTAIDGAGLYAPEQVNPAYETDTGSGDVEAALSRVAVMIDQTYTTPMQTNNPMEPHTTVAVWDADGPHLTLYDSTQGAHAVRKTIAPVLGLEPHQVRVVAPYVGGGFGSKGTTHAHEIVAAMCAQRVLRPVKLALTRQQAFTLVGHRTPTIQRVRLGADSGGQIGVLVHDVCEHTSGIKEFAEQTATISRMMYAATNRRTSHRLAALDVPVPSWMRAPGEAPGSFALEVAMDELAEACGIDPIELRVRNDPDVHPESGNPWSRRALVECLREGATRFGWAAGRSRPGSRREGDWLVGLGVASSTYPSNLLPGSAAEVESAPGGRYTVRIGAVDIGTGAWTVLTQIAADALGCAADAVTVEIGDTDLPPASVAGGSSGTGSWGWTIVDAVRAFRAEHGADPPTGACTRAGTPRNPDAKTHALYSFGAQFAEVRVNADTYEVRVPRMLGVFSAGRIINPRTARSQLLGGMTMGLSAALHEQSVIDHHLGHVVNHDLAEYHVASHADVADLEAVWLDEQDLHANPMGAKGIGEIGIVGAAAAVTNAAYAATGVRVRDLPLVPERFLTV